MDILRILKHLIHPDWFSRRCFPRTSFDRIEAAIAASESTHHGEIYVAVETALDLKPLLRGQTARERALDVFAQHRVWDTEANNGVLIYLLLADRDVEIVADRGVAGRVDAHVWQELCVELESRFGKGEYEDGMLHAIGVVGGHLARLYPRTGADANELSNRPARL